MDIEELTSDKNKIGKIVLLSAGTILLFASAYVYAQIDVDSQEDSFDTNATVVSAEDGNFTAGIETGGVMAFGRIFEGSNVTKRINLESEDLAFTEAEVEGNISGNLEFEEYKMFEGSSRAEFTYQASEPGNYSGQIILNTKTADNRWEELWLESQYRLQS